MYHTVLPLRCRVLQPAVESVRLTHGSALISAQRAVVDETTATARLEREKRPSFLNQFRQDQ